MRIFTKASQRIDNIGLRLSIRLSLMLISDLEGFWAYNLNSFVNLN